MCCYMLLLLPTAMSCDFPHDVTTTLVLYSVTVTVMTVDFV